MEFYVPRCCGFQSWMRLELSVYLAVSVERLYCKRPILCLASSKILGGQMKSGQILSRNISKTVLNIVFKFYTLVTEYISCLQRSVAAQMATGFGPLAEVTWTEAERRCAVVMIITRKGDILTDIKIADLTGVDCRRVN